VEGAYKKVFEIVERLRPDSFMIFSGAEEAQVRKRISISRTSERTSLAGLS
jgi:hypothetical protein